MVISNISHINIHDYLSKVSSNQIRILVCTSGYEERSIFFAKKYFKNFDYRYVLGVDSFQESPIRKSNDLFFKKNRFVFQIEKEYNSKKIVEILKEILNSYGNSNIEIFIDYSSMPRLWYAEVLNFFKSIEIIPKISLIFIYSESKFISPSKEPSYNHYVEPIKGFTYLDTPDRPTALIIGLGYEKSRPLGLKEYFDASKVVLFITSKDSNSEFYFEVEKNNRDLIDLVTSKNPNDIFYYPTDNIKVLFFEIERLIEVLEKNYRLIIAPCGPKFFTLCSLLVSFRNIEIDVWRVSSGENRIPENKIPTGNLLSLKIDLKVI